MSVQFESMDESLSTETVTDDEFGGPEESEELESAPVDDVEDDATPDETGDDEEGSEQVNDSEKKVSVKAVIASRKRAQAAEKEKARIERELYELKGQFQQLQSTLQQKNQEPEEEDLSFEAVNWDYADPENAFVKAQENATKYASAAAKREAERRERALAKKREEEWQETLTASVDVAREMYDDYDDVQERFVARQQKNPRLVALVRKQTDPADWAYRNQIAYEKRQKEKTSGMEKQIEELQEQLASLQGNSKKTKSKSLATARGASSRQPASAGPASGKQVFNAVFGRRRA